MDDRRRAKEEIKTKMEEHGISPEELKESAPAPKKPSREAEEPDLQPGKSRPRRRRSLKDPRATSETRITSGGFFGREPVLGIHRRGIFDDNRPFVSGMKRIIDRPILTGNKRPIVGNRGRVVSNPPAITRRPILGIGRRRRKSEK